MRAQPAFLTDLLLRQRIAACLLRCTTVSLLDIVSTMPSSRNRRAPRIQAALRCLATKAREKCGLANCDRFLELAHRTELKPRDEKVPRFYEEGRFRLPEVQRFMCRWIRGVEWGFIAAQRHVSIAPAAG